MFDHHHHIHYGDSGSEPPWAAALRKQYALILQRMDLIMATQADLTAAVTRNTDAGKAIIQLLDNVAKLLRDAQASGDPAALDAAIALIDADTKATSDAVLANTPGQPTTPA